MPARYARPTVSRARQRAMNRRKGLICVGALALLVVAGLVLLITGGGKPKGTVQAAMEVASTPEPLADAEPADAAPADIPQPTPEPTPEPTAQPAPAAASDRALTRPGAQEGFLPVFLQANTEEKIVAITIDDCYQANNLQQIVDAAMAVGGKLTIFPIGENVLKERQSQILKTAWENGFELENHTFTHNGLYRSSHEELAAEVYKQQLALSYILGVEYQCHFLRPKGGDARHDQRIHAYCKKMGYYGIAHWSASGAADDAKLAKSLKPGAIFLFHCTDKDLEKLLRFIPWVAEQGYQLVTLNEMFGYPPNETSELTVPIEEHVITPLEPYEMVYAALKPTTYCWEAYVLQEKLIAMGYMTGEPDGVYGKGCAKAVAAYQKDHGMKVTEEASADLIREIIEGSGEKSASAGGSDPL